jgi:AAA family ATP:ADP antiporter
MGETKARSSERRRPVKGDDIWRRADSPSDEFAAPVAESANNRSAAEWVWPLQSVSNMTAQARMNRILAGAMRPFAKVAPNEVVEAAVLTLTVFLLLSAYYLLKTAREPLILLSGGAEVKSYAAAGQAALLILFVRGYESIARRVGRLRLLTTVYVFFIGNLLVFAGLAAAEVPVAVPFYLWVGVFNYASIAQFWALAADIYTPEQGKRLFAILGIGSSVGAVAGAQLAAALVHFGPPTLMVAAAGLLVVCVSLIRWVHGRSAAQGPAAPRGEALSADSALALLRGDRFLLLLAALTLVLNWVNANGEYLLDRTLLETLGHGHTHREAAALIGHFKAQYFGWVNLVGVLLQLFVVSRILDRLGVRAALFFLPAVALAGYGLLLAAPVLAAIRVTKVAENSIDYSLQNTARQALYLVANRAEKFVGKTAVDTVFVRLGDVLSSGLVWLGARIALPTKSFAVVNLALIVVWLAIVVMLGTEHRRRAAETLRAAA